PLVGEHDVRPGTASRTAARGRTTPGRGRQAGDRHRPDGLTVGAVVHDDRDRVPVLLDRDQGQHLDLGVVFEVVLDHREDGADQGHVVVERLVAGFVNDEARRDRLAVHGPAAAPISLEPLVAHGSLGNEKAPAKPGRVWYGVWYGYPCLTS